MDANTAHQTGYVQLDGTPFYYEIAGEGHPLVLLHAGIADSRMWDDQFAAFAKHYRVLRYDLRGYGKTPPASSDFSHRADLYNLLQHFGIEKTYLLGCSLGGLIAIDFTLDYPDVTAALILTTSSLGGYEFSGTLPRLYMQTVDAIRKGDYELASELEVRIWVDGPKRTPGEVPEHIRERVREMNIIALRNETAQTGEEQPLSPAAVYRLSEIQTPTLVIIGDLDNPNILVADDLLVGGIAGARKAVMSGTAHLPSMERPEEYNQLVLDFLSELK